MDDRTRIETISEIVKETILRIKSKEKKEYTVEKFFEDACKNWSKLTEEDKSLFAKLVETNEIIKIIKEFK